jgi:hypothetical protein
MSNQQARDVYLYHYTRRFEYLMAALHDGIWPRYVEEDLSEILGEIGQPIWLAISMVCFTDMTPELAQSHRERYGDYALGVSKDFASKVDIQPLIYVVSGGRLAHEIRAHTRPGDDRVRTGGGNPLAVLLPYVKVTPGSQRMRELGREEVWEVLGFEEELEWRYVPAGLPIRDSGGHNRVTDADQKLAERHKLVIPDVYLEFIVVTSREEAQQVVAELPRLREKIHIRQRDGSSQPAF